MKLQKIIRAFVLGTGVLALGSLITAQAATRPISDWINAQGTYALEAFPDGSLDCASSHYGGDAGFLWVPPIRNFLGWSDPAAISMSMDYAGLVNKWLEEEAGMSLGTTINGTIVERPLKDGRAEVTIIMQTQNANTFVVDGWDFYLSPLLVGSRADQIAAGATPALGNCTFQLVFINDTPGAPMPDLMQLLWCTGPKQAVSFLGFSGSAIGLAPDGTPVFCQTRQNGLLEVAGIANGNSRVALDAFPAEKVHVKPVGD